MKQIVVYRNNGVTMNTIFNPLKSPFQLIIIEIWKYSLSLMGSTAELKKRKSQNYKWNKVKLQHILVCFRAIWEFYYVLCVTTNPILDSFFLTEVILGKQI